MLDPGQPGIAFDVDRETGRPLRLVVSAMSVRFPDGQEKRVARVVTTFDTLERLDASSDVVRRSFDLRETYPAMRVPAGYPAALFGRG